MQTQTMTYTNVDIRRVAECFAADLKMLASRTGAMTQKEADDTAYDVTLMAMHRCLVRVHIQLLDASGYLKAAHEYTVRENSDLHGSRPGGNDWPRMPEGNLVVIVSYSDRGKAEELKNGGQLRGKWTSSDLSTNYNGMSSESGRQYSSNGYSWDRSSYIAAKPRRI